MQIQVNTDKNIEGHEDLVGQGEATVTKSLSDFSAHPVSTALAWTTRSTTRVRWSKAWGVRCMPCRPSACLVVPAWQRAFVTDPSAPFPFMTPAPRTAFVPNSKEEPHEDPTQH